MITVGNVEEFALQCSLSKDDPCDGEIFIFIKNEKFGSKTGSFNLNSFFENIAVSLKTFNPFFPPLFNSSALDIFKSLDSVWNDTSIDDCPIETVVPGFFDDPIEVSSKIIFYGGDYAFDGISIVQISNGIRSHLIVRDEQDKRLSDIVIGANDFSGKFMELIYLYRSK